MDSSKLRLLFSKTGKAKYISHLDLMATMRRGFLRAGVELRYSEGFNPHPYMSIALPLPVGCGSACELMDFEPAGGCLTGSLPALMSAALPEGIEVLQVYLPERKFSGIAWLELCGDLFYGADGPPGALDGLTKRFMSESIVISKKTKRGASDINIAPLIRGVKFEKPAPRDRSALGRAETAEYDIIRITVRVSAQNPTLTPANLMSALTGGHGGAAPDFALFTRMEIFDADMNVFR